MKIILITFILTLSAVLPCFAYIIPNAKYPSEDVILAQVIADSSYGIIPGGAADCTEGLKTAIRDCEEMGGGTVFLPAGEYLVTGPVCIPSTVVLRGDWTDPLNNKKDRDPGTVIIAKPAPKALGRSPYDGALFIVEASAGLMGLTFWYPEQNSAAPVAFGPTVCVKPEDDDYVTTNVYRPKKIVSCATLKDLTLINSYRGINAEYSHELCQLETIRVCGLDYGIKMSNSTDVGYSADIFISPDVWLRAGKYSCPDPVSLKYYCRENTEALVLGWLDDETLSDIRINGCNLGIHFLDQGFWGLFYDVEVTDTHTAVLCENLNTWAGAVMSRGVLSGDDYAVKCDSVTGVLKLCGFTLKGKTEGKRLRINDAPVTETLTPRTHFRPEPRLFEPDLKSADKTHTDISGPLQRSLDEAASAGGGIVALPPGIFSLYKPITVPEGVLLTGSSCIFMKDTTDFCGGTVILSYVTDGYSVALKKNAGVNGMRFFCPCFDSVTALGHIEAGSPETGTCCIKGLSDGVYVTNSVVTAAFTGIDFRGCDRHYIKKVFGVCYLSMIAAGGKNGSIEGVLANMHFSQRHCLNQFFDPAKADPERNWYMLGNHIRDLNLRPHCTTVRIEDADREQILNLFMYSPCHLIDTKNSTGTYINVSSDFMYGYQLLFDRSRVRVVNSLRSCGGSVSVTDSDVRITNRIAISNMTELDYDSTKSPVDSYRYTDKIPLCDCETLDGTSLVSLTDDNQYVTEGSHAWLRTGCNKDDNYLVSVRFPDTDISSVWPEGRLHISIYVNDYHNIIWGGQIQLCSGGKQHEQMLCWSLPVFLLNKGWNEVYLPFDSAVPAGAPFEPDHANFITMYSYFGENYDNVFAIDNIFACK